MSRAEQDPVEHWWEAYLQIPFDHLPAGRMYELFDESWPAWMAGFTRLKPGLWVRAINSDITHIVRLAPGKGNLYLLHWGVSLSFVPHEWEGRLRWHRTVKSAWFDLWESAHLRAQTEGEEYRTLMLCGSYGESIVIRQLPAFWAWVEPRIISWFSATATVDGVLQTAYAEMERNRFSYGYKAPSPQIVAAFCLARLGRGDDATVLLNSHVQVREWTPEATENLNRALALARQSSTNLTYLGR